MSKPAVFVLAFAALLSAASPSSLVGADSTTVTPGAASIQPDELRFMDVRFTELKARQVIAPYEAALSKLVAGYLAKLDAAGKAEQAAGHLDAHLALKAERQHVGNLKPVPDVDEESTPAILKALRSAFRTGRMKLEAVRVAELKKLADVLDARLELLEADFTRHARLPDAKLVREYRDALNQGLTLSVPAGGMAGTVKTSITNSLGMQFIPIKGTKVLFCIHETRHRDYAAYAADAKGVDDTWKAVFVNGLPAGDKDDHPVVGISYRDAVAFCAWLSLREGRTYRLPTDREWSIAAGLGRDEKEIKGAPKSLGGGVRKQYPWGTQWPPPAGAGNFADAATKAKIPGSLSLGEYSDGYATTAPVMSFTPGRQGLYDMSGNAEEWVDDWWNAEKRERVLRGASWMHHFSETLLSSNRNHARPDDRSVAGAGFRCVLVSDGAG